MKMISTFLFSLFFVFAAVAQNGQQLTPGKPLGQFNLSYVAGFPLLEFSDELDDTGHGISGNLLVKPEDLPLWVGAGIDYLIFSREKIKFSEPIAQTGISRTYHWITSSQALLLYGIIRYRPEINFFITPYLEGKAGVRGLFTITRLEERNNSEFNIIDSRVNQADWSFAFGAGAGIQVFFDKHKYAALDLYCGWMQGASGDFYTKKKEQGSLSSPLDAFELRRSSRTDLLLPRVGFTFQFFHGTEESGR